VYLGGVALDAQALALAGTLGAEERSRLAEPDTVLIDAADMNKLDVAPGDTAEINGRRVRIVGLTNGLRGLGGVNVIASVATTRAL
ncbi:hypothetical protein, partial [Nostoc sp. CCY 9925]|uniref:hypothetical protein n=1 Tax=Nostoc sp. CCY 9925 TaxID=3103865 RepID=UPI0039C5E43B